MSIHIEIYPDVDEHVAIICRKYWELDPSHKFVFSLAELAKEFGMTSSKVSSLVGKSCIVYWTLLKCLSCGCDYPVDSRTEFNRIFGTHGSNWKCPICSDAEKKAARLEAEQATAGLQARIKADCDLSKRKPIDVFSLSLEQAVYLLTVIRGGASEDISHIKPLDSLEEPLATSQELEREIVMSLYGDGLLHIHPGSPISAFEDGSPNWRFYHRKVFWAPPIGEGMESFEVLNDLEEMARDRIFPMGWESEVMPLWQKIALNECLEYLDLSMEKHGLPANPGPKTHSTLSTLLHTFSVSQMYSLIWRAAKDAAAFYLRERVPKMHAANTVVGAIQRQADTARAKGWLVSSYGRNFNCPQSLLSRVLFGSFLQIGDAGFTTPLSQASKVISTDLARDLPGEESIP